MPFFLLFALHEQDKMPVSFIYNNMLIVTFAIILFWIVNFERYKDVIINIDHLITENWNKHTCFHLLQFFFLPCISKIKNALIVITMSLRYIVTSQYYVDTYSTT